MSFYIKPTQIKVTQHNNLHVCLFLRFQRDGVVDLSEERDAITKSIGLIETGHPFIRSKIMLVFVLTYKKFLSGTKKNKKIKK